MVEPIYRRNWDLFGKDALKSPSTRVEGSSRNTKEHYVIEDRQSADNWGGKNVLNRKRGGRISVDGKKETGGAFR